MRKNILSSLAAIIILVGISGCRTKKRITNAETINTAASRAKINVAEKISSINSSSAKFTSLTARAKTDLNINGDINDVTMNIRIKHNEAIWVSVTAIAGLEIARALITPDSLKVINRLEGMYISKPFSYIHDFTSRQVNFGTLESLLVGNAFKEVLNDQANLQGNNNELTLTQTLGAINYLLNFNTRSKVTQTSLQDTRNSQFLQAAYGDFIDVQGQVMPQSVKIKSQAQRKNVLIDLAYSRVELNQPVEMPFSVPKRFTLKN